MRTRLAGPRVLLAPRLFQGVQCRVCFRFDEDGHVIEGTRGRALQTQELAREVLRDVFDLAQANGDSRCTDSGMPRRYGTTSRFVCQVRDMACAGLASGAWRSPVKTSAATCAHRAAAPKKLGQSHMAESPLMPYLLCMLAGPRSIVLTATNSSHEALQYVAGSRGRVGVGHRGDSGLRRVIGQPRSGWPVERMLSARGREERLPRAARR
jgi:hypothetical protein